MHGMKDESWNGMRWLARSYWLSRPSRPTDLMWFSPSTQSGKFVPSPSIAYSDESLFTRNETDPTPNRAWTTRVTTTL
jgi:hypothetical protein